MAGALVLMILNRLQMLKESRGQECKRPDRETERAGESQGDPAGPPDPTGDVTNCWVTSVSFFQHKAIPLFPPLRYVSKLFLAAAFLRSSLLSLINTITSKFTVSVTSAAQICSSIWGFIPFLPSSLCLWPLFRTEMSLSEENRRINLLET